MSSGEAATRTWDGGGDGLTWAQGANWSDDLAPAATDDAVIPAGLPAAVRVTASTTVRGLQADSAVELAAGTLTLTGTAQLNGPVTLARGTTLTAAGSAATVLVTGATQLGGASLIASGGARLEVSALAAYDAAAVGSATIALRATGAGSVLALPALAEIVNGFAAGDDDARDVELLVEALAGGTLELPALTVLRDTATGRHSGSQINLRADGAGSVVQAPLLGALLDRDLSGWSSAGSSQLIATNGGTLATPALATVQGAALVLASGGVFPAAALTSCTYGTINSSAGTRSFPNLTDGTGSSFLVSGGGRLELPALATYTSASNGSLENYIFRATGAGSVLVLPALGDVLNGFAPGDTDERDRELTLEAVAGGRVELPALVTLRDPATGRHSGSQINLRADGAGSVLTAPLLGSLLDRDLSSWTTQGYSQVSATGGATLDVPQLTSVHGATITRDGTSTLSLAQLASVVRSNLTLSGAGQAFPALTTYRHGTAQISGATLTFAALTDGDGSSFIASAGGTIEVPLLAAYNTAAETDGTRVFRATGAGSTVRFPALATIVRGFEPGDADARDLDLTLEALAGGRVELPLLAAITDVTTGNLAGGNFTLRADGTGSLLALPQLTSALDRSIDAWTTSGVSLVTVTANGQIAAPLLTTLQGTSITLDATGVLPIAQLTSLLRGTITTTGGVRSFTNLAAADGVAFSVSGGGRLEFPALAGYSTVSSGDPGAWLWRASGTGSVLAFPALAEAVNGYAPGDADERDKEFTLEAVSGGRLELPVLATLRDPGTGTHHGSQINLRADGAGSVVAAPQLTALLDRNLDDWVTAGISTLTASAGGQLQLGTTSAGLTVLGTTILVSAGDTLTTSTLTLGSGAALTGGGTVQGSVVNAGLVAPGPAAARLTLTGDYTQTADGRLAVDLGGATAGVQHDQLVVGGTATRAGRLEVTLLSGYTPPAGTAFTIGTHAAGAGGFPTLAGIGVAGGLELFPGYSGTATTLTVDPATGPRVTGVTPVGATVAPLTQFEVTFSELVDPAAFTAADAVITGPTGAFAPAAPVLVAGTTWRLPFAGRIVPGTYTLTLGPGVTDFAGHAMDQNANGTLGEAADTFVHAVSITAGAYTGHWDGGGDGVSWSDAANWVGNTLPTATADVVIDVAGAEVRLTSAVTVRSLTSAAGVRIESGSLTVTGGTSSLSGPLILANNTTLTATGAATALAASGAVTLTNSNLTALAGAHLSLPGFTTHTRSLSGERVWRASGAGSRLTLGALTTLRSPSSNWLYFEALAGGVVDAPVLPAITEASAVYVHASGAGSRVQLPALTSASGTTPNSYFHAELGGEIAAPALTQLAFFGLQLDATGVMPTAQIQRLTGDGRLYLTGGVRNFAALTQLSNIDVDCNGVAPAVPLLADINLSNLTVRGGVTLTLPLVTSYVKSAGGDRILRASGAGSVLALPALTTLSSPFTSAWLYVEGLSGGRLQLPALTTISEGYAVYVHATGAGGRVELPLLTSFQGTAHYSYFAAETGGEIAAPLLAEIINGGLSLDATAIMPVAQLTRLTGGSTFVLTGGTRTFTALQQLEDVTARFNGAAVSFPALTDIDGTSLTVQGGTALTLPLVTRYEKFAGDQILRAEGAGSVLSLPALTDYAELAQSGYQYFEALTSGRVSLPALATLDDVYAVYLHADEVGSRVELPALTSITSNNTHTYFHLTDGGEIVAGTTAPALQTSRLDLRFERLGTFTTNRLVLGAEVVLRGSGTVAGHLTNGGTVAPGWYDAAVERIGRVRVTGDYTQTATGQLQLDTDGAAPGVSFDRLEVSGGATLDGTLALRRLGSYAPVFSDTLLVLPYGSRTGVFATYTGRTLPDNLEWSPAFAGGGLSLVAGVPVTAPSLDTQPAALDLTRGQTAVFSVVARGSLPLTYQWQRDGDDLAGATAATLTLPGLTVEQAGSYRVVVTNLLGSVTSDAATLVVREWAGTPVAPAQAGTLTLPAVPGNGVAIDLFNGLGGDVVPVPATVAGVTPSGRTLSPFVDFPNPGVTVNVGTSFNTFFASTTTPPATVTGLTATNFTLRVAAYLRIEAAMDLLPETPGIDVQLGVGSDDGYHLEIGTVFLGQAGARGFTYSWRLVTFESPGLYPLTLHFAANAAGTSGLELAWQTALTGGTAIIPQPYLYLDLNTEDQLITFEEHAAGTALTDQYRNVGAVFTTVTGQPQITTAQPARFVPVSPVRVWGDPQAPAPAPVVGEVTFVVPGTAIPATTDFVRVFVIDAEGAGARVTAYGIAGDVRVDEVIVTGAGEQRIVELNTPGIARVRFALGSGTETAAIDNLGFLTPVAANAPPVFPPLPDRTVDEGVLLEFTAAATDPDAALPVTFSLPPGSPAGATIDPVTGVFRWTPTEAQGPQVYTVSIVAMDTDPFPASTTVSFDVTVNEVNRAPVLGAIGARYVNASGSLAFFATATDPDLPAQALAFTVQPGAPAGVSIESSNGLFAAVLGSGVADGAHPVTVRVTDAGTPALQDEETFNLIVDRTAPVVTALAPTGTVNAPLSTFDVTFSEPLLAGTFTAADLALSGPGGLVAVTGLSALGGNAYRITFAAQTTAGVYTVTVGPGLSDLAGNAMNQDGDTIFGEATQDRFTGSVTVTASPDLVVENVTITGSGTPGSTAQVAWTVRNLSSVATPAGGWLDAVALSFDGTLASRFAVGASRRDGALAGGATVARTWTFTVPADGPAGAVRAIVETNADREFAEASFSNNATLSGGSLAIPARLTLTLAPASVSEDDGAAAATGTLRRNGSRTAPLVVTVASGDGSSATAPASVTIPAGQTTATFPIAAVADAVVDGPKTVQFTATAGGFPAATATLEVRDADRYTLTLSEPAGLVLEGEEALVTVQRSGPTADALTVTLSSSDPAALTWPASTLFPAGVASVEVVATAPQDTVVEGDRTVTLRAEAPGMTPGTRQLVVVDDDAPVLGLTLATDVIAESGGSTTTTATLTRAAAGASPLAVSLTNNAPAVVTVPASVTFPAGSTAVTFLVTAVNNAVVDGDRTAALGAVVVAGGMIVAQAGPVAVTVLDDDAPRLALEIPPDVVGEGLNPAATVTVSRPAPWTAALTVTLTSSLPAAATVPASVTIPAGAGATTFPLTTVANGTPDGSRLVTLRATAAGLSPGEDNVVVSDETEADLLITELEVPATAATDSTTTVSFRIENRGLALAAASEAAPWVDRVYLSRSGTLADAVLVSQQTFSASVPVGLFYERAVPVRLPRELGDYFVIVETNADLALDEITRANNLRVSATPIRVSAAYTATVAAGITQGFAGQPVVLSGQATLAGGSDPAASVLVNIHLSVRGTKRILSALTDVTGGFSVTWRPLPGEGGRYTVGAAHPGEPEAPVQDEFTLLGVVTTPKALAVTLPEASALAGSFTLTNLSDTPLTGIALAPVGAPAGLTLVTSGAPANLASLADVTVNFVATAAAGAAGSGTFVLRVTSVEGVIHDLPVTWAVQALVPRLRSAVDVVEAAMLVGGQRVVPVTLTNTGGAPTGPLTVLLPAAPWLGLATPATLPSLAPGETTTLELLLTPAADLPLTAYSGTFVIASSTTPASLSLPFNFRAVSDGRGTLEVAVVDEFTYFTEAQPRVAGASVILRDPFDATEIATATTDATGLAVFPDLPSGYYQIEVRAEQHAPARATVLVEADTITGYQVFTSYQAVRYNWTVTETEIQDRYKVTVESTFETNVPVPVVVVEPAVIDLGDLQNEGQALQVDFTFTNHGLIAANNLKITLPTNHPLYRFTALSADLGTLGAKQSLTVPVIVQRLAEPEAPAAVPAGTPGAGGFAAAAVPGAPGGAGSGDAASSNYPCGMGALYIYDYLCGPSSVAGGGPIAVINFAPGNCPGGTFHPRGSGGGSGSIRAAGIASGGNCDPCIDKLLQQGLDCAIKFIPGYDVAKCIYRMSKCAAGPNFNKCVYAAARCRGMFKHPAFKVLECYCGIDCLPKPASGPGYLATFACMVIGAAPPALPQLVAAAALPPAPLTAASTAGGQFASLLTSADDLAATIAPLIYFFGSAEFFRDIEPEQGDAILGALETAGDPASPGGAEIDAAEQAAILALPRPATLTAGMIQAFITRWNTSWEYWEAGIRDAAQVPEPDRANFISLVEMDVMIARSDAAFARGQAYDANGDAFENLVARYTDEILALSEGGSGGVCARVKLRLDQEVVLTRTAFEALLELENGQPATAIEDVQLDLVVTDLFGTPAGERFAVRAPVLANLTAVDGTGMVAPATTGTAKWLLVPNDLAAPAAPTDYLVGGTLTYRLGAQTLRIALVPARITVRPDAALTLKYFHQRDVFSDDPHTGLIEPSEPYTLAVLLANTGAGAARNLSITSAQPQIVDNEKGLLIDFQIIASELTELTAGGATTELTPSLTVNFGDLAPGTTKLGRWLLTSSLQGLFIDYSATFEHLDSLGDPRLSLLKSVTIHELIRQIADAQDRPVFLVNDVPDTRDLPDTVHLSDGTTAPVSVVEAATPDGAPTAGDLVVEVTAALPAGWSYLRVPDPANGQFRLARVQRPDGSDLALGASTWVSDRTFLGGGRRPIRENVLHLADFNSPGRYILTYVSHPASDTTPPVSAVAPLPAESYAQIPVTWTGTDAGGLAGFDVYVSDNGAAPTLWLNDTASTGGLFAGTVGRTYTFYTRARDFSGNVEAAPPVPDATTTVTQINLPPVLDPVPDQTVDEGATLDVQLHATDPNPGTVLAFRLGVDAPPGVIVSAETGQLVWQTTTAHGGFSYPVEVQVFDDGAPRLGAFRVFDVAVGNVNSPPVLAPVLPQAVRAAETLRLVLTATDADLPVQAVTFAIDGTAPAGLTIEAATGLLAWTPPLADVGRTVMVRVRATDSGAPAESATTDLAITVLPNPDATFQQWRTENFTAAQLADPLVSSDTADPNRNLRPNLLDYALGGGAFAAGDPSLGLSTFVVRHATAGTYHARLAFRRRTTDALLTYRPEVSADRQVWLADATALTTIAVTPLAGGFEEVVVEDRTPLSAGASRYFQLKVTRPPLPTP